MRRFLASILLLAAATGAPSLLAQTGNINPAKKSAWSENAGWLDLRPSFGGVTVLPTYLRGYAWEENAGWIKLGGNAGGPYANTGATNYGVNLNSATGALSGYAWSENAGWIQFDPTFGGVTLDLHTKQMSGFAWAENLGWIHFRSTSPVAYGVGLTCPPNAATLCLNNGRFEVSVTWRNPYDGGTTGVGTPFPLAGDSGTFWFFTPSNLELVIKVLDGRTTNGKFWVLYGALSDVEYTITIRDTETDFVKTFFNPGRNLASVADVNALPGDGALSADNDAVIVVPPDYGQLASLLLTNGGEREREVALAVRTEAATQEGSFREPLSTCTAAGDTLCLNANRFQLRVAWTNYNDGSTGSGVAVKLSDDSGYFWFFNSANVELMLKVLDGRTTNGKFWVFFGALSDVGYTLTVTDTETNTVKTYVNPAHKLGSVADINAF